MTLSVFNLHRRRIPLFFFFVTSLLISSLLSACTLGQVNPAEIAASAQVVAATSIALTMTSLPTSTPPPSETPTLSPSPTKTLVPTPVTSRTIALSTAAVTSQPSLTPYGQPQLTDFATQKANKDDKNAPLLLENNSEEQIKFVIVSPFHQEYNFKKNITLILPEGQYTYQAWIGSKGPISGSFSITNGDKHVLTFYKDKIHFSTP